MDILLPILQEFRNIFPKEHLRKADWATFTCFNVVTLNLSSHKKCSIKIAILKNSAIFIGKHCWSFFWIKLQAWRSATLLKRDSNPGFSCKYCEIFKSTFFEKHLWTSVSVHFKLQRGTQHPALKYLRSFFEKLLLRCLTVQNTSLEKKSFYRGGQKFFFVARIFRCALLLVCPIRHAKNRWTKAKCSSNRDTTRNISFCSLLAKLDLQSSF